VKEWRQGEAVVKQQIAGTMPDSLFMKVRGKGTVREIWDGLGDDFRRNPGWCLWIYDNIFSRRCVLRKGMYILIL
jgi:hypothetical protein